MPFTFNGIGTIFYGSRDFRPDGSYITTEWFVFVYLPLIPLNSKRILPVEGDSNYFFYRSSKYYILEKTKLNGRQVLYVYGWLATVLGFLILAAQYENWWFVLPALAMFAVPWCVRGLALDRMRAEERAKEDNSAT